MKNHPRERIQERRVLGIDGWTDYQLLRLLNCYDVWSATPSRTGEPCWTIRANR